MEAATTWRIRRRGRKETRFIFFMLNTEWDWDGLRNAGHVLPRDEWKPAPPTYCLRAPEFHMFYMIQYVLYASKGFASKKRNDDVFSRCRAGETGDLFGIGPLTLKGCLFPISAWAPATACSRIRRGPSPPAEAPRHPAARRPASFRLHAARGPTPEFAAMGSVARVGGADALGSGMSRR